jgi:hypothetical protein
MEVSGKYIGIPRGGAVRSCAQPILIALCLVETGCSDGYWGIDRSGQQQAAMLLERM